MRINLLIALLVWLFFTSVVSPVLAADVNGDANNDGRVDALDYVIWKFNYGKSGGLAQGNFNTDAVVDGKDYAIWYSKFGLVITPTPEGKAYYVSLTGNNNNPGTLASPFRTIQKCANVALPGESCLIRAGTYRETVIPTRSGISDQNITFAPYNNESVTVSGAELVNSSWTLSSGNIYKTTTTIPVLGPSKNQIFVDGSMIQIAKWPNSSGAPLGIKWQLAPSGVTVNGVSHTINDPSFVNTANWGNGSSRIVFMGNAQYYAEEGLVLSAKNGEILTSTTRNLGENTLNNSTIKSKIVPYYLYNNLAALDSPGEWFYDEVSKTLYLQTKSSDNPSSHKVEARVRQNCFDLSGKSFITIKGVNLFSCTIISDLSSKNNTIDGIKAKYLSHSLSNPSPHFFETGIVLYGTNSVLQNSELAYTSAAAVKIMGSDHRIINNVVHDVNYSAANQAAFEMGDERPQRVHILRNTAYNAGRWIQHMGQSAEIKFNDFYNACLLTQDCGTIYSHSDGMGLDGKPTEIAFNKLHDNKATYLAFAGVYIDSGALRPGAPISANYNVFNNLIWNSLNAGIFMKANEDGSPNNYKAYNNNIWNTGSLSITKNTGVINMEVFNNLTSAPVEGTKLSNNFKVSGSLFPNPTPPAPNVGAFRNIDGTVSNWTAGASFAPSL